MNQADALLATGGFPDGVYTTHLLHGKTFGFWTADVEVEPLDGLFATRQSALYYVHDAAKREHERTHEDVVGGYAWHPRIGEAAVWEDICSEFSLNK